MKSEYKILLISKSIRRCESLRALLYSNLKEIKIHLAEDFKEGETVLTQISPRVIIIDHMFLKDEMENGIMACRQIDPAIQILLLGIHPGDSFSGSEYRPDRILGTGFSTADLITEIRQLEN